MTTKKDPPDPPDPSESPEPSDPPEPSESTDPRPAGDESRAKRPMELVAEAIAQALGQLRAAQAPDIDVAAAKARGQIQDLMAKIDSTVKDPEVRQAAVREIEKLTALMLNFGSAIGSALAAYGAPVAHTMKGANTEKLVEGMKLLADYLNHPSPEKAAHMKARLAELGIEPSVDDPDDPDDETTN